MTRFLLPLALLVAFATPARAEPLPKDAVVVLAPLHGLHARVSAFTHDDLRRLLDAAAPDVLVVETRPDELSGRTDTPGRPEYPAVVWPWLKTRAVTVEAMEPGGETFAQMTGAAGAKYARFEKEHPAASAKADQLQRTLTLALLARWRHPADAHDQATGDLVEAGVLSEQALGGPGADAGQAAWDGFMIERVRRVAATHPGKRIVVLASYRNLRAFRAGLASEPRLVDAEPWIRSLDVFD